MKKLISLLCIAMLLVSLLNTAAFADEEKASAPLENWAYCGITLNSEDLGISSVYYAAAYFTREGILNPLTVEPYTAEELAAIIDGAVVGAEGYVVNIPADAVVGVSAFGREDAICWFDEKNAVSILSSSDPLVLNSETGEICNLSGEVVATAMAGKTSEEKYKVTEEFQVAGKLCLITGAAGNAGGHFALGMPAASGCDAVLADILEYQDEMDEVVRDIETAELPVKIAVEMIQEEDLKDREAFYESLEQKYGPFACILDVYGINTARTFPGSAEITQKPVLAAEDMKPRYQAGPNMLFNGKTVLVLGAGGLWGSHMAAGMAAAEADLILVNTVDKEDAIGELCELIGDSVQIQVEYVTEEMYNDRAALLEHIQRICGTPDAILDVRAINPTE